MVYCYLMIQRDSIHIPLEQLCDYCRNHYIRKMSLFGSVLRDDYKPESDIDILVEFEPEHTPGFSFFDIQEDLSKIFGKVVDLHTPQDLSPYFIDQVLQQCKVIYDATG